MLRLSRAGTYPDPSLIRRIALRRGNLGVASRMLQRRNAARNYGYGNPFGQARIVARGLQQRMARNYRFAQSRNKRPTSGIGFTTQHDRKLVYRKKVMPKRFKRRWKSFVRKVNTISEKDLGTRTVVLNYSLDTVNNNATYHSVCSMGLYTLKATIPMNNDLNYIASLENYHADPTTTKGITVEDSTKIMFQSAVLDVTIRNTSTFFDGSTSSLSSNAALEMDIYEMSSSKPFENTTNQYDGIGTLLQAECAYTANIGGTGNQIEMQTRGSTPWDVPFALGRYGIKIWKKTKFFIPNGQTITYQIRDPKRHVETIKNLANQNGANKPGWTKWIMCVYKLVPGLTVGSTANTYQERIAIGQTAKYMYKVEGANDSRDRYRQQSASLLLPI